MEDFKVVKCHFAYQVRLDLSHNSISECLIEKWLDKFNIVMFLFGREFKDSNGVPHYQGIVWIESKWTSDQHTTARNWWRKKCLVSYGKSGKKAQGHSLTSARKIQNLSKYCKKDGNYWTNLSDSQIATIGEWRDAEFLKKQKKDQLKKLLDEGVVECTNLANFYCLYQRSYKSIYERKATKNCVISAAYVYDILSELDLFQMDFPNYYQDPTGTHRFC